MYLKKITLPFLFFFIGQLCIFPQNSETWFPIGISGIIRDYISGITSMDKDSIRSDYLTILLFVEENITAFRENIERSLTNTIFSERRPAIVDGRLVIVERDVGTIFIWNNELDIYLEYPDIDIIFLLVEIISFIRIHNHLLDFWHRKTGELLRDYIHEYTLRDDVLRFTNHRIKVPLIE